ncbi:MAG: tetratricopeptide repeat protein [Chloroflexi bacterium]|nr:tetratricopeptide repeat protein [Chloroflexota bacterium]
MEHHLTVANALPHGLADQFRGAGYPKGRFQILPVIAQTIHGDADYYNLPMNQFVQSGISGAPLLAPNGEVVAMFRTSESNIAGAVRLETMKKFLNGEIGVECGSSGLKACLDEATRHTRRLADGGDIAAQFQLGRGGRYIPGDPELRWLRRAAEGGHASAQREMGNALYDGARGLEQDWKRSNHWLRLAAEQEDPVAQHNLSISYFYGEGLTKDVSKGLEWLHRALRNGYVLAEANLGFMYYEGDGLRMDEELGRYWLQRAAARGDEEAKKVLDEARD